MRTSLGELQREQWEQYACSLLAIRYRASFQRVPARFGGDLGIDGFTLDGMLFQCYCPDGNPTGRDLYDGQRDKITSDIRKLIRNVKRVAGLVPAVITEWHFVTPYYESRELISHCRKKEGQVRREMHPAIRDDFRILLQCEDDFIPERQVYVGSSGLRLQPSAAVPDPDDIIELRESGSSIVSSIERKVRRMDIAPQTRTRLVLNLITNYVIGQDELETLDSKLPRTYMAVTQLKAAIEAQLPIRVAAVEGGHGTVLRGILTEYEEKLESQFSEALSSALISHLSSEAISDWLGRCPLDPNPEKEGGHESE